MINFSKAKFIKSCANYLDRPDKNYKEVVFIGKSNVGKSSLINALTKNKSLAFTSSKPGYTKLLNYFEIDEKFYLVDAPGYGYTKTGSKHLDSFSDMMETYFDNKFLAGVVLIIDSRHELGKNDIDFYNFIINKNIPFMLVASKIDKLNQSEKAKMKNNIQSKISDKQFFPVSVVKNLGLDEIKKEIEKFLYN